MLRARNGEQGFNASGEPWHMKEPKVSTSNVQGLESHCLEAVHTGRSGMEPIGRWLVWCGEQGVFRSGGTELDWGIVELAFKVEASAVVLASSLHATVLGLGTACETVRGQGGWRNGGGGRQGSARSDRLARNRGLRYQTCGNRVSGLFTCAGAGA